MPVITRAELENAQIDVFDLARIINGAANVANPGQDPGTVTTRLGQVVRTLSKLVADGFELVESRLDPIIYTSSAAREGDVLNVIPGQTCFDKEDTNLYICVQEPLGDPPELTNVWSQLSDLQKAAQAPFEDQLDGTSSVGRITVSDYKFMEEREFRYSKEGLKDHHIQFPGKTTLSEGLAKTLNYTVWPTTHMLQENVDFGCRFDQGDLNAASTWVDWIDATKTFNVRNDNPNIIEQYYVNGFISINSGYEAPIYIRDCIVDPNYTKLQAITKSSGFDAELYVEYCTLRRFQQEAINLNRGHLAYCNIELSQGDGLKAGGRDVILHGNMIRKLGQDLPTAHADALQVQDIDGLEMTSNTLYMPGTGTAWDEGTYGSTQCLRLVTENNAHDIKNVYVVGNLFIGGGFTVALRSRFTGSTVENIVIANNVIGGKFGGNPYWVFGPISQEHWAENSPGVKRNILFHNNIMSDGTGFNTETIGTPQGGTNQNGMWYFDKQYASPKFLELGKRFGYLDWNGDLRSGVVSRTTG